MPTSAEICEQFKELLPRPQPRGIEVATHLSPANASATAIQRLAAGIAPTITAEVILGIVGWYGARGAPSAPFPVYRLGFMAWGFAANTPQLRASSELSESLILASVEPTQSRYRNKQ